PKCRKEGEDIRACLQRKVPELVDEGMEKEEAVAAAYDMCEEPCSEDEDVEEKKEESEEDTEDEEPKEDVKESKEEEEEEDKTLAEKLKEENEKEVEESEGEEDVYRACMRKQMKKGKSLVQAAKACKKELDLEDVPEVQSGSKSKSESQEGPINLSDANKIYKEYLDKGKVLPAQKEQFVGLVQSLGNRINLSDSNSKVGGLDTLRKFLDTQPKVIDFEEKGQGVQMSDDSSSTDQTEEGEIPEKAKEVFSKMGLSDEQAQRAYQEAKKQKEEERKASESIL
ncbi:MAG: hypothetical protein ACOCTT_04025, partial [archaeon]